MKHWIVRILICLILGAITTVAVAWGCAAWCPVASLETSTVPGLGTETYALQHATYILGPADIGDDANSDRFAAAVHYETIGRSRLVWLHAVGNHRRGMITRGPGGVVVFSLDSRARRIESNPVRWSRVKLPQAMNSAGRSPRMTTFVLEDAAGWPFRALTSQASSPRWQQWDRTSSTDAIVFEDDSALVTGGWLNDNFRMLPLRPIPLGFIANSIIFASVFLAVSPFLEWVRRYDRRRRGRCPRCGYDLRGNTEVAAGCPECGWERVEFPP